MQRVIYRFIGIVLVISITSCASKHEGHGHDQHTSNDADVWKEMDDFHMIMAETFHPYKDSANLDPAKNRAGELLAAADTWLAAPLPEKVDVDEVNEKLKLLKSQAAELAESVKSSNDNVIAARLTDLHETFHAIQEMWYRK